MIIEKMGLSPRSLAGQVAVVTGAGRGIGRELARALAWLGAKVVIAEIAETGADVEAQIRSEGGEALFVKTDVAEEKSIRRLAARASEHFGKVDILVNNAIIYRTGAILELPLETWDQVYAVNLRGAVVATKTFLPGMLERKEGTIVTVTSAEGMPYAASYFASKAALKSVGWSLAAELGDESGVSVFVFAPGMVDTPGVAEALRDMAPRYGMTYEEFVNQGVNPGYEGLMPAEDCAAGFAHAIVHASEYHGQIADPFQALAKAGVLHVTRAPGPTDGGAGAPSTSATPPPTVESVSLLQEAVTCAAELRQVMHRVSDEFDGLDRFRKGWVKRDFRANCGVSIEAWLEATDSLESELDTLVRAAEGGEAAEAEPIRA